MIDRQTDRQTYTDRHTDRQTASHTDFETSKGWVLESHVDTDDVINDRIGFMRLQRRRDGQARRTVAIENVNLVIFRDIYLTSSLWPQRGIT